MIKLVIGPLNIRKNIDFTNEILNPGIGGTEFQLLSLAFILRSKFNMNVSILCTDEIFLNDSLGELKTIKLKDNLTFPEDTILISPVSSIRLIEPKSANSAKIILSSHHPHDTNVNKIRKKYKIQLVRVVGAYSYLSSNIKKNPTVYIPNLFLSEMQIHDLPKHSIIHKIGNISSFHRSKGLHHVLRIFLNLSKNKKFDFEIIGSIKLYLNDSDSINFFQRNLLRVYKNKITKYINLIEYRGADLNVHGLQANGVAQLISKWKLAIINPLGIGESDPASIKDCLANGVPVFTTGDFGTWDYARNFPAISCKNISQIPKKILEYLSNEEIQRETEMKCFELARYLDNRNEEILQTWLNVLQIIKNHSDQESDFPKIFQPTFISKNLNNKLRFRNLLSHVPLLLLIQNSLRDRYYEWRIRL